MIKKFFLKGLLLLGGMFLLFNCQQDDFAESRLSAENQDNYSISRISFKELKENPKAFQELKKANAKSISSNGRGVYNEDYGVFVDTTNIVMIEKEGNHSITFHIIGDNYDRVDNLVLKLNGDGSYTGYKVSYMFTEEEMSQLQENTVLTDKIPYSVVEMDRVSNSQTGRAEVSGPCISTSTVTQSICHPANGGPSITYAPNTYTGGCNGIMEYKTTQVISIDLGCMSGGGGGGNGTFSPNMPGNTGGNPVTSTPGGSYTPGGNNPRNDIPGSGNNGSGTNPTTPPTNPADQTHNPGDGPIITTPLLVLDASKAFYNNLDSGQKQWWNNAVNSIAKREILTYLEEDTYSEESKAFGKWAIDYLKANPSVTIEQFENRFMGTSDGQDGEYDSAYWDNPNLTFPTQSLPTWNNFKAAFPLDKDPLYDTALKMLNSIGGEVANFYNGPETNTCAFRLSKALNYSGVVIPNIPGQTFKGRDNKYYFKAAYQINLWMRKTFGTSPTNPNHYSITGAEAGVHGVELPTLLSEIKGIYSLYSSDFTWASGHADLLYPDATCGNNCHFYDAPIHRIEVWELN